MSDMIEETTEMSDGCPMKAVIDISKSDLEAGKYDTFVNALNAALMHLEIPDLRAFITKQDLSGRWKFQFVKADEDVPADVVDSKDGIQEMEGVVSEEDADKPPLPTEEPREYVPQEGEILLSDEDIDERNDECVDGDGSSLG